MKKILFSTIACFSEIISFAQDTTASRLNDTLMLENIEVISIRAAEKAPFAKTDINRMQIEKNNLGQDLPFVLNQVPSVVVSSDAGNGIGYTGIRLRGSDASRINVTLNGIPYNDAESQGTFFVDLPDILSSVGSIQVQRGVGTSSNGAGAFGGTINLSTNEVNKDRYAELNNSYGSFNTIKNTIRLGTGIFAKHFTIDARVSGLKSDGYIDRATSNLRSFYVSASYINSNSSLRFNILNGKEKTYQAWYGVLQSYLDTNRTFNPAGMEKPGSPYSNETDNYTQTHYQLFYNRKINASVQFNTAFFLTRGKGYYEEYRAGEYFGDYGLPDYINGNDTLTNTDLIRQLWLDNYFYGAIFSVKYTHKRTALTFGGGWNSYDGDHYNVVTWAEQGISPGYRYTDLPANKKDLNIYGKILQTVAPGLYAFADVQARFVKYHISGFDDHPRLAIREAYSFFNPKIGFTYDKNNFKTFVSYAVAAKEPNRSDFEAENNQLPKPEILHDIELGIEKKVSNYSAGATFYYMNYKDQLVNTGKINDVGAYTRTNTPKSYRMGVEIEAAAIFTTWLNASGNIAFSANKIKNFQEYVDDYDNGGQLVNEFKNTDISFSPSVISASSVNILPQKNSQMSFISKYVSRQFLDNTSDLTRSLDAYFTEDVRVSYSLKKIFFKQVDFIFQVNNLFNKKYEPNGYTYNYFYGGKLAVENYYYPMAGTNFMAAVNIKL